MNNFHKAKLVATIGPAIDKETILAKIINNIDVFRINLAHGDEDTKKKYIDMVVKLDSSKTILLDTKWPEIRTRSKYELEYTNNQEVTIKFAEFFKEEDDTIFIDYPYIEDIVPGSIMSIDNDTVTVEITKNHTEYLTWKVVKAGSVLINRSIEFDNYIPKLPFLSEEDKKHIVRWANNKANVIAISYIRNKDDVTLIRNFLNKIGARHLKILAKIETKDAVENIKEIVEFADGVSLNKNKLEIIVGKDSLYETKKYIIDTCNTIGKPILMNTSLWTTQEENALWYATLMEDMKLWVDTFVLTKETAVLEHALDLVSEVYERINNPENIIHREHSLDQINIDDDKYIADYMIYNAYRIAQELDIKAIICPTESGHTPARLSSLKPNVPIISFTKNDEAYRYINLLWWVKGYKISSTFDYTNIKQIGKEIIRILFKGNISLDDKILIVQSSLAQNVSNMINGIELYKFKDI